MLILGNKKSLKMTKPTQVKNFLHQGQTFFKKMGGENKIETKIRGA